MHQNVIRIFDKISRLNGFKNAYGGWFKESDECLVALDLQKSNYDNYYVLNIKIFVQGIFGNVYTKHKNLIKREVGTVFIRPPETYREIFDLSNSLNEKERQEKLVLLFLDFLNPFAKEALSKVGLKRLYQEERILLLPAVQKELESV